MKIQWNWIQTLEQAGSISGTKNFHIIISCQEHQIVAQKVTVFYTSSFASFSLQTFMELWTGKLLGKVYLISVGEICVCNVLKWNANLHTEIELWPQFTIAFNPRTLPPLWNKVLNFLRLIWGSEVQKCHTFIDNQIIILENTASCGLCPFSLNRKMNIGLNIFPLHPSSDDTFPIFTFCGTVSLDCKLL